MLEAARVAEFLPSYVGRLSHRTRNVLRRMRRRSTPVAAFLAAGGTLLAPEGDDRSSMRRRLLLVAVLLPSGSGQWPEPIYGRVEPRAWGPRSIPGPKSVSVRVFLGDFPSCMHMSTTVTVDNLNEWRTPEGIGLGSAEEDALRTYGSPVREEKADSTICKAPIRG